MQRRQVVGALTTATVLGAGATGLAGCSEAGEGVTRFADITQAIAAIEAVRVDGRTRSGWPLAQVLNHVAQGVEYSIGAGFPQLKPALFRHTVGAIAFGVFDARGAMSHSLTEPVPGAPALDVPAKLAEASQRCIQAFQALQAFTGQPHPHFAYGSLSLAQNQRAHLMHLANHWTLVVPRA